MTGPTGSCHCGAVEVTLSSAPVELSECNCSICRRIAGLWHYCSVDDAAVTGPCEGYVQGDRTLTTWRCEHCGCVTHWTAIDPAYRRMGINLRMFDPEIWMDLPRRLVDGASF
ncbi:MAG: GFA family protein [Novosphingobium sp.]